MGPLLGAGEEAHHMTDNSDGDGYAYNEAGWIVIRGWDEHNPGHTRSYSWIQVKKRLLRHPQYLELSYAQRGVLLGLWILTAELGLGCVPARPESVWMLLGTSAENDKRWLRRHLISLNQAGWFTIDACKMPAPKEREKGSKEPKKEIENARTAHAASSAAHAQNGEPPSPEKVKWLERIHQARQNGDTDEMTRLFGKKPA